MNNFRIASLFSLAALVIFLSGCAVSVISEDVLSGVDRAITLPMVQSDPDAYTGTSVLWGGTIVTTTNLSDHSRVEVLARELAYMDTPMTNSSESQGRFIILAPGYLDKLVYKPGTGVTVVGKVKGVEKMKIGELDYPYVLISQIEVKTFTPETKLDRRDYPFDNPYGYPYDPFLDPGFSPFFGPRYPGLPPYYYYPPGFNPPGHHHH
jgi:outer membrane lipoprotein